MSDAVLVAVVSGLVSLSGSIISMIATNIRARQQSDLMIYRISQLEEKLTRHDCLGERVALVEQSAKSAHNRINSLEERRNSA